MYPHRKDRSKVIAVATQGRLQLEEQIAQEREQMAQKQPLGWHEEPSDGKQG
jgi:glutathione-regulated potassium-efflux system ancillary protein KefC